MNVCETNHGDGCGLVFSHKTSSGLCTKCAKLASLKEGTQAYEEYKNYGQCVSCGGAWKNLMQPKCGRCSALSVGSALTVPSIDNAQTLARAAVEASRAARASSMEARLTKQPAPSPAMSSPLHTTSGLLAAKHGISTGENKVFIRVECRIRSTAKKDQKSTDFDCGQWGKPWPKEVYLSEVLDDYLTTLNAHWGKAYGRELIRDEVEFRWSGNKIFLPGTASSLVGEVYNTYMTGEMAHFYKADSSRATKKASGGKPQYEMALELFIDKPKFNLRTKVNEQSLIDSLPARKRSGTRSEYPGENSKRHASAFGDGLIPSTFVRTRHVSSAGVDTSSLIRIKTANITCDKETGVVHIGWPENGKIEKALLDKSYFAKGATKYVYKMSIDSSVYAAKRFYELGRDDDVTAGENKDYLEKELIRLKTTAWFLTRFKADAKKAHVEISEDVTVSEGLLVCEMGEPSPASSLPPFPEDTAVWLVEPRRTTSVQKFSGTMVHPDRNDKVGKTMSAFTHFVYAESGEELVIADIQGSPMTVNGRDTLVIFDPMTHSRDADSGIGDHGEEGIDAFISQHQCNHICQGLRLGTLGTKAAGDSKLNSDDEVSISDKDELEDDQ